jgi:hypothetical protein
MTPDDANPDFANFLVPGVGLAPVTEFRVLITLFVLLIGPVNYWLLKRSGRLHLLVLTVPLAAVLMTSALFGYAILSDGFGTTVRAQSLTTLDQRTGEAACWSRLSYYSGLAPGDGLTMPSDVAVYPIIPGWNDPNIDANIGGGREIHSDSILDRPRTQVAAPDRAHAGRRYAPRHQRAGHNDPLPAGGGRRRSIVCRGKSARLVDDSAGGHRQSVGDQATAAARVG